MEKKKIIQIVVISVCFIGSGVVLYNGLYSSPKATAVPASTSPMPGAQAGATVSVPANNSSALLPYGDKPLDFSNLKKDGRFQFDAVNFATISTSTDIGVDIPDLIK